MKVTLRKASALMSSLQDAAKAVIVQTHVELNEFQDPIAMLESSRAQLLDADEQRDRLVVAAYTIRKLIGAANSDAGITDILAAVAYVDKRIVQLAELKTLPPHMSLDVISGRLAKITATSEEHRRYGGDTIDTTVVSPTDLAEFSAKYAAMKRQKQELADQLLALNVQTYITIPDDVATLLLENGLV